jgi:RNA recognition motif-containing protein
VEIIQDRATSKPRGFGFVELEDGAMAEHAVRSLNGKLFAGRALTVGWATPIRESA